MEPLFAIGVWALSLAGIAAVVFAARKAAAIPDLGKMMMEPFISSHRDQFGGCYDENRSPRCYDARWRSGATRGRYRSTPLAVSS